MKTTKTSAILLMLTCCLALPLACDKNITGSSGQNGKGETGYYLYVGNQGVTDRYGGNKVFIVDTNTNAIVDSVGGFQQDMINLKASKDGEKLYVVTTGVYDKGKIHVIDVRSRTPLLLLDDVETDVFIAPDGQVFAIVYERHAPDAYLGRIDPRTDEVAFFDTLDIWFGLSTDQTVAFDTSRSLLYGINSDEKLFAYNYREQRLVRTYDNILVPRSMIISPDGDYLYIAGGPVVDLERGEAIARLGGNVLGSLALSPDGTLLYITDPGRYAHGLSFPTGKFYVYDTRSYRYIDEIDVSKGFSSRLVTDWIVLSPDGKIAYVSNWPESVLVVDLQSKQVMDTIPFRFVIRPIALAIKP